jgi:hypothetical protein
MAFGIMTTIMTFSILIFSIMTFSIVTFICRTIRKCNTQHYDIHDIQLCCVSFTLSVTIKSIMSSVIRLGVIMLNVMALY